MSDALADAIRREAHRAMGSIRSTRAGLVSSYDPQTHTARVKLQPDDVETGWIPVWTPFVGTGWGLVAAPDLGSQVVILFFEGEPDNGLVIGGLFSKPEPAPLNPKTAAAVASKEFVLVHASGSALAFSNDGTVMVKSAAEMHLMSATTMVLDAPNGMTVNANVTHNGWLKSSGDITDQTGAGNVKTVKQLRDGYNGHHHTGVTPGGGSSGTTDAPV